MKQTFHCFFEQSGTFKNEFKKLGYKAYDYDILNDFNETDYVCDLYKEIEMAYINSPSIFDKIQSGYGTILAFFPCIRFEDQILLLFRGDSSQQQKHSLKQKLDRDILLHKELNYLYELISKLVIVCLDRKIPLIIENPKGHSHYLNTYWCLKPSVVDTDRTMRGDHYKKPTQYWFINREPSNNFIFEPMIANERKNVDRASTIERSMISKDYANRFIREFIL